MSKIYFDERIAEGYDATSAEMFEPEAVEPVVSFLAELAGHGRALELGIGTGRIALPLSRRGVPVHGIDLSQPMVSRLREIGYQGYVSLELMNPTLWRANPKQVAEVGITSLRKVLGMADT